MTSAQNKKTFSQSTKRPSRNPAEWFTFSIASLILAAIAGLIVYIWATDRDRPAVLVIERNEQVRQEENQFYVPFEISNTGGETVDSVQVVAELRVDGTVKEAGDLQIDFLSGGEKEKATFIFNQDPRKGELIIRVASYKEP